MKAIPKIDPSNLPKVKHWTYPSREELHKTFAGLISQSSFTGAPVYMAQINCNPKGKREGKEEGE